jgi:hypothetical protein
MTLLSNIYMVSETVVLVHNIDIKSTQQICSASLRYSIIIKSKLSSAFHRRIRIDSYEHQHHREDLAFFVQAK